MYLNFYREERKLYERAFETELCGDDTRFVGRKIIKHFKIDCYWINVVSVRNGHAYSHAISLPRRTDFGMLCHELAHVWEKQKYGKTEHRKRLMKLIGRIVRYCEKKNYWKAELDKRHQPKPPKPKPTKQEIREKKIEKTMEKIKRYERKIKMYSTKLKKAKRSLMMLERYKNGTMEKADEK